MHIHRFSSEQEATTKLYDVVRTLLQQNPHPRVGISGGHSPIPLYQHIAEKKEAMFTEASYFLVDERFVPMFHPESNIGHLLQIFDDDFSIHGWDTMFDSREEANQDYEEVIKGSPMDVCILGAGVDGHVASIFPNTAAVESNGVTTTCIATSAPVRERVTLTLPFLFQSKHILLLLKGDEDAKVLDLLQAGGKPPVECPVMAFKSHADFHIFLIP